MKLDNASSKGSMELEESFYSDCEVFVIGLMNLWAVIFAGG